MRHIILALFLCSVVGLAGCGSLGSNVKELSGVVSSLLTLDNAHESVRATILSRVDAMPAEDRHAIESADAELQLLRDLGRSITKGGNAASLVANVQRARLMWSQARAAYVNAREVITRNAGLFTTQQIRQLQIYDRQAAILDESVELLLKNPDNGRALSIMSTTLEVGSAAARILLLL